LIIAVIHTTYAVVKLRLEKIPAPRWLADSSVQHYVGIAEVEGSNPVQA